MEHLPPFSAPASSNGIPIPTTMPYLGHLYLRDECRHKNAQSKLCHDCKSNLMGWDHYWERMAGQDTESYLARADDRSIPVPADPRLRYIVFHQRMRALGTGLLTSSTEDRLVQQSSEWEVSIFA